MARATTALTAGTVRDRRIGVPLDYNYAGPAHLIQPACNTSCGAGEVRYRYGESTRLDGSTYPHGLGRLTSVSEETGQSRYEYDVRGRQVAVVVLLRRDVAEPLAAGAAVLVLGLFLFPDGRRRTAALGLRLRRGPVLGLTVIFAIGTLPWPLLVRPARATGSGGGGVTPVYHYHLDHLGSTAVVSDQYGMVVEQVRSTPYGQVSRWQVSGRAWTPTPLHLHEFTGYQTEWNSGLQYAGARFYDPKLGMFLTPDPARQFASPYAYVGWDPVNGTDPDGAFVCGGLCIMAIGAVAGALASGIQAAVDGATPAQALKAAAIGGAIGAVTAPIGAYVLHPALSSILSGPMVGMTAAAANTYASGILLSSSIAQAGYGLTRGDYSGTIGLGVSVGIGLAISQGAEGEAAVAGTSGSARSLAIVDALLHGQRVGVGDITYTGLDFPDVVSTGEANLGDLIEVVDTFGKFFPTVENSHIYHSLVQRAERIVELKAGAGKLFEARLEIIRGTIEPSTGIGTLDTIRGLGFPSAPPFGRFANPAAGKLWLLLRATGGPLPSAGPSIEAVITDPSGLSLSREIYLSGA